MKKWLPYIFPVVVVVIVGYLSITHQPFDSFDETNTIRIVNQSFSSIVAILNHESNFPLFYFLLKVLRSALFNNDVLLQVIYFLSYVLSGIFFYKTISYFTSNKSLTLTALGVFYSIPALIYHASYIRMYNFAILLSLAGLYFLLRYINAEKSKDYLLAVCIFALICVLHPLGVIAAVIFIPLLLSQKITNKQKLLTIAVLLLAGVVYAIQVLVKQHTAETFVVTGTKYIRTLNITFGTAGFFYHFASTVIKPRNANYLITFPLFVTLITDTILVYWTLFRKKTLSLIDQVGMTSFLMYLVVPVLFGTKIYIHHLHYVLGFGIFGIAYALLNYGGTILKTINKHVRIVFALSMTSLSVLLVYVFKTIIVSANATTENNPYIMLLIGVILVVAYVYVASSKQLLAITTSLILLACTITYYFYIPITVNSQRCAYFRDEVEHNNEYFFIQHNESNLYFNCLKSNNNVVLMDEHRELFYAADHSDTDILIEQAKRGGSYALFNEVQDIFTSDTSLVEYNKIKNISVLILGDGNCKDEKQSVTPIIRGFKFVSCGRYTEYLYTRSQ